ncbi:response regulator transcription factor [Clostridiaceae bacterium 35-E11]
MIREKILVVDDESEIRDLIYLYLNREGFQVLEASNGQEARELTYHERPDLIILDILLPAQDGLELCSQLRKTTDAPIIFLSCKSEDIDKILGLTVGGDDYITKPFSPRELVARVKAHLRRTHLQFRKNEQKQILRYPGLEIYLSSHSVLVNDKPVFLTAKEFELLTFFAQNPNRVFYTDQIFEKIWKTYGLEGDTRTVMVHISNLRKKIERNPANPKYILTVRGIGYKFNGLLESI